MGGRCVTNLRYADDIVFIASSEEELKNTVNRLHEAATEMGMKLNAKKTEVMKVRDDPSPMTVTVAVGRNQVVQMNSEATCDEKITVQLALTRHRMSDELLPVSFIEIAHSQQQIKSSSHSGVPRWSGSLA